MEVMREETFGPVLPITPVASVEEAIKLANDSPYGLSGSVWTADIDHGMRIASRIHTGSVSVNDMAVTYGIPEAPFGGRKESGVGQANGEIGVKSFCHAQPIVIDRFGGKQTAQQYPYSKAGEKTMQRIIRGIWGKGLGRIR
jgi:succinate-semialdehyde dehydrogenase/glutarate-semialdehyde dehydrogenase